MSPDEKRFGPVCTALTAAEQQHERAIDSALQAMLNAPHRDARRHAAAIWSGLLDVRSGHAAALLDFAQYGVSA